MLIRYVCWVYAKVKEAPERIIVETDHLILEHSYTVFMDFRKAHPSACSVSFSHRAQAFRLDLRETFHTQKPYAVPPDEVVYRDPFSFDMTLHVSLHGFFWETWLPGDGTKSWISSSEGWGALNDMLNLSVLTGANNVMVRR